jgi:hypothetical protein
VPRREHREVLVIELSDGLRVVLGELRLGNVVDPRLDHLGEQRPTGPAPDRVGDHPDRLRELDEAQLQATLELSFTRAHRAGT